MNIKLLKKVRAYILRYPKKFSVESYNNPLSDVRCIGGLVYHFGKNAKNENGVPRLAEPNAPRGQLCGQLAAQFLGVSWVVAQELFYGFEDYGKLKPGGVKYARIGARQIDQFIATHGLNVKLMEKVRAHILKNPSDFNMNMFNNSGSWHCIGGWVLALGLTPEELQKHFCDFNSTSDSQKAAQLLRADFERARNMFYDFFPYSGYTPGTLAYAKCGARQITKFIRANT